MRNELRPSIWISPFDLVDNLPEWNRLCTSSIWTVPSGRDGVRGI
jgi:hypothetical protein